MPAGRFLPWFALLTSQLACFAQSNLILFPITNSWRYEQSTNLDGTNWQFPAFNDSAWPNGAGLLYVEDNVAVNPRNTPLTIGRATYYFRTHFQFTNSVAGLGLVFSNLVDDGAVFYLNGVEIQRLRMPLPPTTITYGTLATLTAEATSYDVFTVSGDALTNLVAADNVLAVEVHQVIVTSSDVVFGTALSTAYSTGAFMFTEQPTNVTVLDGRPAHLRVNTSANIQPALQWYKDGNPVPGATFPTISFSATFPSHAGTYWVVASNTSLVLTSEQATVTVQADNIPPTVLRAVAQKNLTNIVIDFSEPVRPEATNLSNFQIVRAGQPTNTLIILNATLTNQTNLVITTTPRADRRNYELRLTNIVDFAFASNQVSSAPIALKYLTELLRIDTNSLWRFDQSGICAPTNWFTPDFDDSTWQTGGPLFTASPSGPVPIGVTLGLANFLGSGSVITYYFRTEFDLPGISTNALFSGTSSTMELCCT